MGRLTDRCNALDEKVELRKVSTDDLTRDFQAEFDKINEFMGGLVDKLDELQSRIKSLEDRKPDPKA